MSHKLVSLYIGEGEYYTRTDADNVIAELNGNIAQLEDDNALLRRNNAELREATRWRKFPYEKPTENVVLALFRSELDKTLYSVDEVLYSSNLDEFFCETDHTKSLNVEYWMYRPEAPEVK